MAKNTKDQRLNMVESQVRPNDVTDNRIITAMLKIERENFVPKASRSLAYMEGDIAIPAEEGETGARALLAPMVLAKLIQLADIMDTDLVLDVGCASGYSTAILASLAEAVVGLEQGAGRVEKATNNLAAANIDNAAIVEGPLNEGYPSQGPYDVILLNGRIPQSPEKLLSQLKPGGRLVGILGEGVSGKAVIWLNTGQAWTSREAFEAQASDLPGFELAREFIF